ncbi:Amino-acid acetyltransferase, mitochondrial [Lecanosticta acicola]|uniref:Amino-acid acetyltransferase, mitochondrial n=1 Tax=Lecanosticta acicola TaxID=111012 RepID=A0AAI8Z1Q5_9PEZI|nr:Amino-acid acetyltransferase, mitochondrial [Lecanosticta acicola]
MTIPMYSCTKAPACGGLKKATVHCARQYSSTSKSPPPPPVNGKHGARADDPQTQRDLFVNVLNANATRRDAKQYLSRFKQPEKSNAEPKPDLYALLEERNARHRKDQDRLDRLGVNLGGLYAPARAIANSPRFTQQDEVRKQSISAPVQQQEIHVALACLRAPEDIDDATIDGLARTLAQLVRLDMRIVLVLDTNGHGPINPGDVRALRKLLAQQADRLCDAIDRHNAEGGRSVPNALEVTDNDGDIHVTLPDLLMDPLRRGMIPIVPTMAYTGAGQVVPVSVLDIMTGLTRHIIGTDKHSQTSKASEDEHVQLDRIILLDSVGGIPSKDRGDGAHVFINLEQEFDDIAEELSEYAAESKENPDSQIGPWVFRQHQKNMFAVRKCLELLPPSSSALIVSPSEAASASRSAASLQATPISTGTRRQRNPLIHNLLTNKPLISSSLPTARLTTSPDDQSAHLNVATVLRRGMPLKVIPAARRGQGWQRPKNGFTTLSLEDDPRVDLRRLVHLIEDSFRRKLNVKHYLNRVQNRIAGVIVAGDYEGGAILTWEMPPGVNDPNRLVPYLDKFAVLQTSQGSSGVADIVFQAMVRSCFPDGVCWRSRKDNPVNKWYLERATGTWKIPNSNWTMFWTGDDVVEGEQKWSDYVGVCSHIAASWADDGKKPD